MSATTFTVSSTEDLYDALSRATGGDRIELAAGEYTLDLSANSGFDITYDAPVTITSADPGNVATFTQMTLNGVSNLTIDNLLFDYTAPEGAADWARPFRIKSSESVTIKNSVFEGDLASGVSDAVDGYGTGYALGIGASSDILISDNEFTTWTRGVIVDKSQNIAISNNNIHSIRSDGINLIEVSSILIENNFIHDFITAPDSGDHADMIQMWSYGTTVASRDVVIRGNTLDIGDGSTTQSIFLGNELAAQDGSGDEVFYQNILIEENIIFNSHSHGISVGATNGLTVRNNSVLSVEDPDLIPRINVASASTNVTIEQNATAAISGFTDQSDWTVTENAIVQNRDPNAAGYYEVEFLTSSLGGRSEDIIVDPESLVAKLGAGASRLQLDTTPEVLVPAFDVTSDPDDAGVLVFDATHTYGPSGQINDAEATFTWDFGDGTRATGPRLQHEFETPGTHQVTLTVKLSDGTEVSTQGTIAVPGQDVLAFNAETGAFESQGYGETLAVEGTETASISFNGQQALDIGSSSTNIGIPKEALDRFFGTEDFTLSMTIVADTPGSSGEVLGLHTVLGLQITQDGHVNFQLSTDSDHVKMTTLPAGTFSPSQSGIQVNDGQPHDITVAFDGATDTVQIIVDGQFAAAAQIEGVMPPMAHWGLAFGGSWGNASFDGKLLAFDLDATARLYPEFTGDISGIADTSAQTVPSETASDPELQTEEPSLEPETEINSRTIEDPAPEALEEDPAPEAVKEEDAGLILPELDGWELDFAALGTSKSSLRGDAFVTTDEAGTSAVVFDGQGDYARLGRLVEYETAEALTASVSFQRTNPDEDYERIFWNHEKFGIGVFGDSLFVHVASPDGEFSDPFRIHDLGLADTEEHNVRVAIDEMTDRVQVILDGELVFDEQATDIDISGVGAPQWFVGTKINPGFEGSVSELQLQPEALFVDDGILIA
ncbi:PKD domain-containing protein [Rhodosalinus sp. K401]|uniref:PKD domain-containing protein n=1 Tax=Rhodosalinus sp. K401 TaxID=3239195 RepID=UPI003523DE08